MKESTLPKKAMKQIEEKLANTLAIQKRILRYNPKTFAIIFGPGSLIPSALNSLTWAAHCCQAARYSLYLAHHEYIYYSKFRKPPRQGTAILMAVWMFTAFSLHLIGAENHLSSAILLFTGQSLPKNKNGVARQLPLKKVVEMEQVKSKEPELANTLSQLVNSTNNQWIRKYRERWFHLDPVIVDELGIQFRESDKEPWEKDEEKGTLTLGVGGGDKPEITVEEMLEKGDRGFNFFGEVFNYSAFFMEENIRERWDDNHFSKVITIKKPRKIPFKPMLSAI